MNIEEIKEYARENGLPEKRIAEFVALLHPDKNGELDALESMRATITIASIAHAREDIKRNLEAVRRLRDSRGGQE